MAIRLYKPTSPARRFMSVLTYEEITKKAPEKSLVEVLKNLNAEKKALVVLPEREENVVRATANLAQAATTYVNTLNVYDILNAGKLIMTKAALALVEEVYA